MRQQQDRAIAGSGRAAEHGVAVREPQALAEPLRAEIAVEPSIVGRPRDCHQHAQPHEDQCGHPQGWQRRRRPPCRQPVAPAPSQRTDRKRDAHGRNGQERPIHRAIAGAVAEMFEVAGDVIQQEPEHQHGPQFETTPAPRPRRIGSHQAHQQREQPQHAGLRRHEWLDQRYPVVRLHPADQRLRRREGTGQHRSRAEHRVVQVPRGQHVVHPVAGQHPHQEGETTSGQHHGDDQGLVLAQASRCCGRPRAGQACRTSHGD